MLNSFAQAPQVSSRPECDSSMVRGLQQVSDVRLVEMFQHDPLLGRVGIALFCRYDPQVKALLQQLWGAQPTAQVWHQAWHHLLDGLLAGGNKELKLWIPEQISLWYQVHHKEHSAFEPSLDPSSPEQSDDMGSLSPVLTWYVKLALEQLDPLERFVLLLKDRFGWADEHIVGQLQKEGYPHLQIPEVLHQARYLCLEHVPPDIRALYLTTKP